MAVEALEDGSKRFVMRGGPADGITLRLYPYNDGWEELLYGGTLYIAPDVQDPRKPFMVCAKNLED